MATKINTRLPAVVRLAHCYQFERYRLATILAGDHDDDDTAGPVAYVLPTCWNAGNPVWHKLYTFCRTRKIDPVRYVRWCLELNRVGLAPPPEPNQLLRPAAMRAFEAGLRDVRKNLEVTFELEKRTALRDILVAQSLHGDEPAFANLCVVTDSHLPLSPLFRFVLARSIGGKEMLRRAEIFEQAALYQFSKHPTEYQAVYGADGWLPEGFAEKAARYYDLLVQKYDKKYAGGKI